MKKNILALSIVAIFASLTFWLMAQQQDDNQAERDKVAAAGLQKLIELTDPQTEKMTGVSAERLKSARLGTAVQLNYVNSNSLKNADSVSGINAYLLENKEYYYPVEAGGIAIASIEVVKTKENKWETGQIGGFKTAPAVSTIINQILKSDSAVSKSTIRLIHSGQLGILFVGFEKAGQQFLSPVFTRTEGDFRAGEILTDKIALERLRGLYQKTNLDLPD